MADDEWSALDEELEKALSGKKGRGKGGRGGDRGGLDHGSNRAGHPPPPPVRRDAPAPPPAAPLDEWSALDEELEKLERRGKGSNKHRGNEGAGSRRPDQPPNQPQRHEQQHQQQRQQHQQQHQRQHHQLPREAPRPVPPPAAAPPANPAAERDAKLAARAARFAEPPAAPPVASSSSAPSASSTTPRDPLHPDAETGTTSTTSTSAATTYTSTTSASRAHHIVGTCRLMCPPSERRSRELAREMDLLERVDPSDPSVSSESLAVKKFTRVVDNPAPDTIRDKAALDATLAHLYGLLGGRADYSAQTGEIPLVRRTNFLWDRLRGVRQDMSLQAMRDAWAVERLEQMARFAVATEYLLCEERMGMGTGGDGGGGGGGGGTGGAHNSHLHVEQLGKTLVTLAHAYDDAACEPEKVTDAPPPVPSSSSSSTAPASSSSSCSNSYPNEGEMLCYRLLLRMDTHGPFRRPDGSAFLRDLRGASRRALASPEVAFALDARREYYAGNCAGFFKLVASDRCSYLQACCLHRYFARARRRALEAAAATFNATPLPMATVAREVVFADEDETERLVRECGLTVVEAEDAGGEKTVAFKATPFVEPGEERVARRERIVERKAPATKSGFFRWRALIEGTAGR